MGWAGHWAAPPLFQQVRSFLRRKEAVLLLGVRRLVSPARAGLAAQGPLTRVRCTVLGNAGDRRDGGR